LALTSSIGGRLTTPLTSHHSSLLRSQQQSITFNRIRQISNMMGTSNSAPAKTAATSPVTSTATSEVKGAASDATKPTSEYEVQTATFGAGCFWSVELAFQRVPGVTYTAVGYIPIHLFK
jgi:hypothetical protein